MSYNEQIFDGCCDALWCLIPEFDNMADAIIAIGPGKPFLAKITNTEGREYRQVVVTPCDDQQFTVECPADMDENPCINLEEIYPTIIGPCGTEMVFSSFTFFDENNLSAQYGWYGVYETILCSECEDIPDSCCIDGEYSVWFNATVELIEAIPVEDSFNYRYRVTFFIQDSCGRLYECSYVYLAVDC